MVERETAEERDDSIGETSDGWRRAQCRTAVEKPSPFVDNEFLPDTHAMQVGRFLTTLRALASIGHNGPAAPNLVLALNHEVQCLAYSLGGFYSQMIADLVDEGGFINLPKQELDRVMLLLCCHVALQGILPQAREGEEFVMVPMPARLATEIVDSISALNMGETPKLFAARKTGLHSDPHTWQQWRIRALQHVEFLRGKGSKKKAAQLAVSAAMKVRWEALRDWDKKLSALHGTELAHAHRAGQVEAVPQAGPIEADVDVVLKWFRTVSLADFGQRYERRYGRRHNAA